MQGRSRRARHHQHAGRRQADGESAALRDVPALAAVGAVRGAARGGRSRQAEARVLLRRGASPVQRRPQGADGQDRAGGAADPLQGRRRLFRHAEPARRARQGAGAARQPGAARAACVHAARPEGRARRGRDLPRQPEARYRDRHQRARQGRGAGVVPGRQRHALDGGALHGAPAFRACRPGHAGGAQGRGAEEPAEGQIRSGDRLRVGLRGADAAHQRDRGAGPSAGQGGQAGQTAPQGEARRRKAAAARQHRRHARVDLRHQPPARQAPLHRAADHARDHPLGHQPRRRPDRREHRQVDRRLDGQLRSAARSCAGRWAASCADEGRRGRASVHCDAGAKAVATVAPGLGAIRLGIAATRGRPPRPE